jgi:hypothetical protein
VVYSLIIDARPPPAWLSGTNRKQHAARLRDALGVLSRSASLRWHDDGTVTVRLRYEPDERMGVEVHQTALAALLEAVDQAGLHARRAVVSRIASHWTQGAVAGALTGLGLSQTQEDELRPIITLAAIAMGAIAGALLRREVPVFRAVCLPRAGWRLVGVEPEVSGARFRVGLA